MRPGDVALQERADGVVADAERLREQQPAGADDQAAECRPPHPVNGQLGEGVLGQLDRGGQRRRERAGEQAGDDTAGKAGEADRRRDAAAPGTAARDRAAARRAAAAVALASATGMKLRGFHSNSSSSTARITAATGEANVADMPAAAPATSSVLRSALVRWKNWAITEPNAPPVMMIGPSAPNGPPDPIEIADDSGLSSATFGCTRLPFIRIASIASGMPWPRIRSDP